MNMKKMLALALAVLMIVGASVAGTIAWLTDTSDEVKNTFTTGDIVIKLDEALVDENGTKKDGERVQENSYKLIPGSTYYKDPTVVVEKGSEPCYLFVEFDAPEADYLNYGFALKDNEEWTQGDTVNGVPENVWFREVDATEAEFSQGLLVDNQIGIDSTKLTKETMPENGSTPLMSFKAYAVQKANVASAAAAWEILFPTT